MFRTVLFSLFLIAVSVPYAYAQIDTSARQAYMIDYDTGTVLFAKMRMSACLHPP